MAALATMIVQARGVRRERRRIAGALLAMSLAVTTLGACAAVDAPRPSERGEVRPGGPRRDDTLAIGEMVPDFAAPGLDGGLVRWRDRGAAPTVLVVWASWCPHCRRLLPSLTRVARSYPAVRLLTVTTSIGRRDGPSPRELVEQQGLAVPVAVDDADNTLARALGVFRYPTVYWVGRDGAVRGTSEGEGSEAALRTAFEALLASSP